jgi:hypothetical protein
MFARCAGRDIIEAQANAESHGYKGEITFLKSIPSVSISPAFYQI